MAQLYLTVVLVIAMCICVTLGDTQPQPELIPGEDGREGNSQAPNVHCTCNCALPAPQDRQTCDSVGRLQSDLDALLSWKGTATNLLHHLKNALQLVSNRLDDVVDIRSEPKELWLLVANISGEIRQQIGEVAKSIILRVKEPYPLGVESRQIPDAQMTASSEFENQHGPRRGRLYTVDDGEGTGAWCAKNNDGDQWLQVDLGQAANVWGVETQGRYGHQQWVSTYRLDFSTDGNHWWPYIDGAGQEKVFQGNSDSNTPLRHLLASPVTARYVRFYVLTWHNHICMRVEVLGGSL